MRYRPFLATLVLLAVSGLAACNEEIVIPEPMTLTRDAVGHYCNMIIEDHPGPKAQIFEDGVEAPFWFTSVRDALFYRSLPGEGTRILVVYVQDTAAITDWANPPADGLRIKLEDAVFVVNSAKRGGMGAREAVSFARREDAEKFRDQYGGEIVSYTEIPEDYLTGDDAAMPHTSDAGPSHTVH